MKKLLWIGALSTLLLTSCGDEEKPKFEETADTTISDSEPVEEKKTWNESLEEIINSSDAPSDKFYSLETVMKDAEVSEDDVKSFKQEILSAYKEKRYLSNPTDDEIMLSLIFKSYIVEQNAENEWKDFAFDFHQNVKYVYRGEETPESDSVKSNEEQMDKIIKKLN